MDSARDTRQGRPRRVGCPIRRSRDHRSLASPPGFSQRAASFLASQCQGIHQMPFNARFHTIPPRTTASPGRSDPRDRPAERPPLGAHEDTFRDPRRPTAGAPGLPPRSLVQLPLHPVKQHPAPRPRGTAPASKHRRPGGGERDRTDDLLLAKQALSRLSYTPARPLVGQGGFEPPTSRLSSARSNRLSY